MAEKRTKFFIITLLLLSAFIILPEGRAQMMPESQAQMAWKQMDIAIAKPFVKKGITLEDAAREIVMQGISGVAKNNVFAVGREESTKTGVIFHYDGDPKNIWKAIQPDEQPKSLNSVCKGTDNTLFAVGDGGTVFIGKAKEWKKFMQNDEYGNLKGVWVSPGMTIFAVGNKGILKHITKEKKSFFHNIDKPLNSVWGFSEQQLVAVGDNGSIFLSKNGGNDWEQQNNNPDSQKNRLNSLWGFSDKALFAVGDGGTILFSDNGGNTWVQQKIRDKENHNLTHNLRSIWGISPDAVYAVGDNGTVLLYKNKQWSEVKSATIDLTNIDIRAIWISPNPNAFIIGPGGFIAVSGLGYPIHGCIRDACAPIIPPATDPKGIPYAKVCEVTPTGCNPITTADGNGSYVPSPIPSPNPKVRFYDNNGKYKKEEATLALYRDKSTPNTTFLLPDPTVPAPLTGANCCIAGDISKRCGSSYCPLAGIKVNIYEMDEDCEWQFRDYKMTNASGFYNFTGLPQGSYKILPEAITGCTFTPEITTVVNVPIVSSPVAINFTDSTLTGTGPCLCTGDPLNPCNIE